jgi:hypothetical protein
MCEVISMFLVVACNGAEAVELRVSTAVISLLPLQRLLTVIQRRASLAVGH